MGALSTATWRGYSRWVSLCFNDKDLYDDRVLINKFKRCYGSVGLQAVLLSQNDHDSRWFDWKITSVGLNSAMQRIKLIHILQLQPNWERSCESSDINCFFLPSFLSLLDVSSMLLSYAANCSILHSLSQIKSVLVWLVRGWFHSVIEVSPPERYFAFTDVLVPRYTTVLWGWFCKYGYRIWWDNLASALRHGRQEGVVTCSGE